MEKGFLFRGRPLNNDQCRVSQEDEGTRSIDTEVDFCIMALERALTIGTPEIFNYDQGSQFTSLDFTKQLKQNDIRISMDGRGRAMNNIFNERR